MSALTKLKVKNDFIFQRIFGKKENKDILISFLNAVMELEILDVEIDDNTKLDKDRIEDKQGVLDIKAKLYDGTQVNIEIQLVNQYNMEKRTLFYWSKLYSDQIKEGESYSKLKKTVTINILDFEYTTLGKYHSVFHLWEDYNKEYRLTDIMEIRFLELPKFRKLKPDLSKPLDRWLMFIDGYPEEMIDVAKEYDPAIKKAEKILEYLGTNEEIIRMYESRQKAIHDEISRLEGAKAEGINQTAVNMLKEGISKDLIAKCTGLSDKDINEIHELIKKH